MKNRQQPPSSGASPREKRPKVASRNPVREVMREGRKGTVAVCPHKFERTMTLRKTNISSIARGLKMSPNTLGKVAKGVAVNRSTLVPGYPVPTSVPLPTAAKVDQPELTRMSCQHEVCGLQITVNELAHVVHQAKTVDGSPEQAKALRNARPNRPASSYPIEVPLEIDPGNPLHEETILTIQPPMIDQGGKGTGMGWQATKASAKLLASLVEGDDNCQATRPLGRRTKVPNEPPAPVPMREQFKHFVGCPVKADRLVGLLQSGARFPATSVHAARFPKADAKRFKAYPGGA